MVVAGYGGFYRGFCGFVERDGKGGVCCSCYIIIIFARFL